EPVPRDMLLATLDRPVEDSGVAHEPGDVLAQLIELGLIEGSAGVVYLRNDLARHLQDRPTDGRAQTAVEQSLAAAVEQLTHARDTTSLRLLYPHLTAITDLAYNRNDEQAAQL